MLKRCTPFLSLLFAISVSAQDWLPFTDSSALFTAKYPATWKSKIKENGAVFFTSPKDGEEDNFLENVNLVTRKNPSFDSSFDLKESMPAILKSLESQMTKFKIVSERYFTWNNQKAAEIKYTLDSKGTTDNSVLHIKITQWLSAQNGIFYTATYTSLDGNSLHDKTAVKILQSIRFR